MMFAMDATFLGWVVSAWSMEACGMWRLPSEDGKLSNVYVRLPSEDDCQHEAWMEATSEVIVISMEACDGGYLLRG
ncbi:hypothetical protein AVEN_208438-1 [Araneus ventricosus]|uniref:Secreted protein n=1 Tax=Araneus ventricosus TaxID=182803 RepID=A0A4Y2EER9_ARAVE|nr:hypothetical protein AVEN_208438-1 [Araneus ventricosus]